MKEGFPTQTRSQLSNQGFVFEEAKSHGTIFQPQLNHKGANSWQKPTKHPTCKVNESNQKFGQKTNISQTSPLKTFTNWPGGRDSPAFPISVCHRACHQLRRSVGKSLELQGIFFSIFGFGGEGYTNVSFWANWFSQPVFDIDLYIAIEIMFLKLWTHDNLLARCIHVIYNIYNTYIYIFLFVAKNYPHKML